MSKYKFIAVVVVLICGPIIFYPPQSYVEGKGDDPKKREIILMQYLAELGSKYNCFFTIEEAWKEGDPINKMESYLVQISTTSGGLQQELENLRQAVPNLTFEFDKRNPQIVHIIDARLTKQNEYGLEKVLKSINFSGSVNDLVVAIGNQGVPVSPPILTDTRESMSQDLSTVVKINEKALKVREALSSFIRLEGRGKVIWIARTKLGEKEVSYIQYHGPKRIS